MDNQNSDVIWPKLFHHEPCLHLVNLLQDLSDESSKSESKKFLETDGESNESEEDEEGRGYRRRPKPERELQRDSRYMLLLLCPRFYSKFKHFLQVSSRKKSR